ncbi:MAG: extracellular solute-binding protein [Thermomicrobiales bacterium]|nr:extracellular solute-binding protein [Thermomicrobiales bacterium]MCO5225024.1 extracellular solute-binding protein [Thermomicrobiales bacterium]MCO5227873.1 extracellular solute-binding protein [Thermomicrobiales bacterium]
MPDRLLNRRSLLTGVTALPLVLTACGSDEPETPAPTATLEPTQAPPTPTQIPLASPVPGYQDAGRWEGRTLTVATAGVGEFLDALTMSFFEPFAADTGCIVEHASLNREGVEGVASQVESGNIVWDIVLMPRNQVLELSNAGVLAAIDYDVVNGDTLYPELMMQHGVGAMLYSTTMVYSVSVEQPPESWADFWDLSRYDGTRALRRTPVGTLEFALLADGVPIDQLYPLDIERAFAQLELIREATLFYEDSKQPVELVRTGQVGLASAWTVRTSLPDVASLVLPIWNGGMVSADAWVSPRGSENADVAMSFINYATRAVPTANFSGMQPFGPVNKGALDLMRADIVETLPNAPQHLDVQFFENWSFWRDRRDDLTARFEEWLLNPPEATPSS